MTADDDLDEYAFRAENCRRVASTLRDPKVVAELLALARHYEEISERLRRAADAESKDSENDK